MRSNAASFAGGALFPRACAEVCAEDGELNPNGSVAAVQRARLDPDHEREGHGGRARTAVVEARVRVFDVSRVFSKRAHALDLGTDDAAEPGFLDLNLDLGDVERVTRVVLGSAPDPCGHLERDDE